MYSTCTINPEENRKNAEWFIKHFPFEKEGIKGLLPEALKEYVIEDHRLQLLPGEVECDGFFIAKFRRK